MTRDLGQAPIAVALDTADVAAAVAIARAVAPSVSTVKVGLELFCAEGPAAVEKIRAEAGDVELMLDLKLHDIPATVAGAARAVSRLSPRILTVHALGGSTMIRRAADELPATLIAAVTILTSHDAAELHDLGINGDPATAVRRLALLAVSAGARALVCSPQEVADVRAAVGPDVTLITPGVRPAGSARDDQSRIATPEQALADGADLLVIGRPITAGDDPGRAAADIAARLR